MAKTFAFIATIFLLASCAAAPVRPDGRTVMVGNVPFYPQAAYQCGPASLAGVMNYLGVKATPEEIAKEIYSGSARGTLNIDMLLYAQRKGLDAVQYAGSWDDLKAKIGGGQPLIVLVDYGIWVYRKDHFMVVTGYNENGVFSNSGKKEGLFIGKDSFLDVWKRADYWTLLLRRKAGTK